MIVGSPFLLFPFFLSLPQVAIHMAVNLGIALSVWKELLSPMSWLDMHMTRHFPLLARFPRQERENPTAGPWKSKKKRINLKQDVGFYVLLSFFPLPSLTQPPGRHTKVIETLSPGFYPDVLNQRST